MISLNNFTSNNDEMNKCIELAKAASQTTASILISGESGIGKKFLAELIHQASDRNNVNSILFHVQQLLLKLLK